MKPIKAYLAIVVVLALFFMVRVGVAQHTLLDTTLAKKYYELGDKYYSSQDLDSSNIYYQKAADVFKQIAKQNNDNLMWAKHARRRQKRGSA